MEGDREVVRRCRLGFAGTPRIADLIPRLPSFQQRSSRLFYRVLAGSWGIFRQGSGVPASGLSECRKFAGSWVCFQQIRLFFRCFGLAGMLEVGKESVCRMLDLKSIFDPDRPIGQSIVHVHSFANGESTVTHSTGFAEPVTIDRAMPPSRFADLLPRVGPGWVFDPRTGQLVILASDNEWIMFTNEFGSFGIRRRDYKWPDVAQGISPFKSSLNAGENALTTHAKDPPSVCAHGVGKDGLTETP
jgi:hypothetical protein